MVSLSWFREELRDPAFRRRAISTALALAIELTIFLLLLMFGTRHAGPLAPKQKEFRLIIPSETPDPAKDAAAKGPKAPQHTPQAATAPKVSKPKEIAPPLPPPVIPPKLIQMNQDAFAASDISKLPKAGADGGAASGGGNGGGAVYGPGQGRGGQQLFNAEWVREPTHAELATYMPKGVEPQWAEIACKTIEHFHVENCYSLGESPPGSGLARAMRLASWQFLVRPERAGNRPLVGTMVRIHFTWTLIKAEEKSADDQ